MSRPRAAYRAIAIVLLASLLCLAGCQRSASSGTATTGSVMQKVSPAGAPASNASVTTSNVAAEKPAADQGTREPAARPAAATPAPSPVPVPARDTGVLGLLCQGAQDGTLPEDFEIGPLGAARLLGEDERAAYAAAASLLEAFIRGRVDRTRLAADSRDALAGTIAYALEQDDLPVSWRLGPPRSTGSELVANLRLLGTDGSAEGELYSRREGGDFLVSDLQIDPARMRVRRERSDRRFFPSPYRWLLGG